MLINCKDCKKQISDQARTCPHCGCPTDIQKSIDATKRLMDEHQRKKDILNPFKAIGFIFGGK
jgi:hypothetical protein